MRKYFKLLLSFLILAVVSVSLIACNNGNPAEQPNPDSQEENTTTVSAIYDSLDITIDVKNELETEVKSIVADVYGNADIIAYGIDGGCLQVIAMVGDELSSLVVSLPQDTESCLDDNVKDNVLSKAGLTAEQEVKESEKSLIVEKITNAVDYIESGIDSISDLPVGNVNYYTNGETTENADKTFSVIGPVLEDGTFQIFDISTNGDLYETIISVPGSANKTPEQIYQDYYDGNYIASASKLIDLNSTYTAPKPIDPENPGEVEDEISFEEIYNQVFGENYVVPTAEEELNKILVNAVPNATNLKLLFADTTDNNLVLYFDGLSMLGRTSFGYATYKENAENLNDYIKLLKDIQETGSLKTYLSEIYNDGSIIENSEEHQIILNNLEKYKTLLLDGQNTADGITSSSFTTRSIINQTTSTLPTQDVNDFGEALLEDMGVEGTIIATYVGDIGARQIDSGNMFDNSGYYSRYSMTVVYQTSNGISITSCDIYNAWFTDSTNESLYGNLINGTKDYQLGTPKTETIDNPLMLNEKNVEELSISL